LIYEGGERIQDGACSNVIPDVISAELHHHYVRLRNCKPSWKLVVGNDPCSKESAVAIIIAIIGDATALGRKSANEVDVGYTSILEFLVEKRSPATLDMLVNGH
jgi:hypothetical protein